LNGKKSTLVISQNGFFNPQIIQNGIVTGIWKKTDNKNDVIIKTDFFQKPGKTTLLKLKKESVRFGKFFNKKSDLIIN